MEIELAHEMLLDNEGKELFVHKANVEQAVFGATKTFFRSGHA
jgi:hypothetical protein